MRRERDSVRRVVFGEGEAAADGGEYEEDDDEQDDEHRVVGAVGRARHSGA